MKNNYFILYQDCFIINGVKKSIIYDSFEEKYVYITQEIQSSNPNYCTKINKDNIAFFNFLKETNYGYFADNPQNLRREITWDSPIEISEIILEIDYNTNISKLCEIISINNFTYLQVRILKNSLYNDISNILEVISKSSIRSAEYFLPYEKLHSSIFNLIRDFSRTKIIYLYNSPVNEIKQIENVFFVYTTQNLIDHTQCGIVDEHYFSSNIKDISKNRFYNSCLSHKLHIDKDGNIKNCPSMSQSFGNIKDTTLEEALNHPDFKKYWNVTKDQIEVCKDCEFRHICTDCRAYTERTHFEGDIDLSKPLKCGYNPYTNEWAEWSTNPLKQKAIEYYGMQELVKLSDVR